MIILLWFFLMTAGGDSPVTGSMDAYDVVHYDLVIDLDMSHKSFSGSTTMSVRWRRDGPEFLLHASDETLTIDSVSMGGEPLPFSRQHDTLRVRLKVRADDPDLHRLNIAYHGMSNFKGQYEGGGIYFSRPDCAGSISEPSYARNWWPCKDLPSDKATASVSITVPESLTAVSTGVLKNTLRRGGRATFHWETQYQIATYLIAIAVGPYREDSTWYVGLNGDSMKVRYYVFPEDYQKTVVDFQNTADILGYFSRTFCEYPFIREKFGFAEVDGDLTMENQTCVSIQHDLITGERKYELPSVVHETAHQWWGNLVTPKTWRNTWLSEGFAEYSEALYLEHRRGSELYRHYIGQIGAFPPGTFAGSVAGRSDTAFWDSFAPRVYHKGALVLHMLRGVIGDTLFFRVLRAYATDPALRYGNAETADFIRICEQTCGKPLGWFFDEWVFASPDSLDRPLYEYSWTAEPSRPATGSGYTLTLDLRQTGANFVYRMPITVSAYHGGKETAFTVTDSMKTQSFTLPVSGRPDSVIVDKDNWVFKQIERKEKF